jgi:serine/threonine protein kinase
MGIVLSRAAIEPESGLLRYKLILLGPHASQEFVQRFHIEALAAASLQHPNLVTIYEVGFRDDQHFLAMGVRCGTKPGGNLCGKVLSRPTGGGYVKDDRRSNPLCARTRRADIAISSLRTCSIDPFDQPKVTDFGLAKLLPSDSSLVH